MSNMHFLDVGKNALVSASPPASMCCFLLDATAIIGLAAAFF